jgi:16S rRNA (cytosine967-C5)-methyltransferase
MTVLGTDVTESRDAALDVLREVRKGRFAEHALWDRFENRPGLAVEDRSLATELVFGVLRERDRLDAIIGRCVDRPSVRIQQRIRDILRIALYQIFLLDRIPDHAAVDQAVAQAAKRAGRKPSGFVNAILRRALRDRDRVDPEPSDSPESLGEYYSHPAWLVRRWLAEQGPDTTLRILRANNRKPRVVVRVNTLATSPRDLLDSWRRAEIHAHAVPFLPDALALVSAGRPVASLPGFEEGLFVMQDPAAQMIAPLLGVRPRERILDACAAPGGKTSHLAALISDDAEIVAVDKEPRRLADARENLQRLRIRCVRTVHGDATDRSFMKSLDFFDRVLLDPPCSNLGVLRRSPEARYRTNSEDLTNFAGIQARMIRAAADVVKPGGTLVYSVCTVTEEETSEIIGRFLSARPDFTIDPIAHHESPLTGLIDKQGYFRTFPPPEDTDLDGFFSARLRRNR